MTKIKPSSLSTDAPQATTSTKRIINYSQMGTPQNAINSLISHQSESHMSYNTINSIKNSASTVKTQELKLLQNLMRDKGLLKQIIDL